MEIRPIKTKNDYRRALKEVERLMTARRGTPEGDRLDVLVTLVEAYEAKHFPLDLPDPVEAIKYHMEQQGLRAADLVPFIGSRNRVYEVLRRKRPLTLRMVWRLHKGLGIPAESLIRQPEDESAELDAVDVAVGTPEGRISPRREGTATAARRRWGQSIRDAPHQSL
jgi:HTH-type transcriptional regulator/antitoxin HigA